MIYGYARVSTMGQDLESQIEELKRKGCEVVYSEKYTGTQTDRPKFNELLEKLQEGDTLMVTKLDRFARSAIQGSELVKDLLSRGIIVHIINMGTLDNTPASKLVRNIFFSFAEFERDMIVERTQEGRRYAKENNPNFREGRPRVAKPQMDRAMRMLVDEGLSYKEVAEQTGISKATVYREAARRGLTKKQREIAEK